MEPEKESPDGPTTFNNEALVQNQGVYQTFHGDVFFGGRSSQIDYTSIDSGLSRIDQEVLRSLAFPEMLDRRSSISLPHDPACDWILGLTEYNDWASSSDGLLSIKGKPGTGKSTSIAFLYHEFKKSLAPTHGILLEFFFDRQGTELQRSPLGMLRSLLSQLYRQDPNSRSKLTELYQEKCTGFGGGQRYWEWKRAELERILRDELIARSQRQPFTLFVDALDEAGAICSQELNVYLYQINKAITTSGGVGKMCISSRHYPVVSSWSNAEISMESHNHGDIATWINDSLCSSWYTNSDSFEYRLRNLLSNELAQVSKGIFQWAQHVAPLVERKINDGKSITEIRDFLPKAPGSMGDVYEDILRNTIAIEDRNLSFLLFQWVYLAEAPLSVTEIRHALSAKYATITPRKVRCHETNMFVQSDEVMERQIKTLSGGLAEVVADKKTKIKTVQFIHQSVNAFLLSRGLSVLFELQGSDLGSFSLREITKQPSDKDLLEYCQGVLYRSCLNYIATEDPSP